MRRAGLLILLVAAAVGMAACGGDDDDSATEATTTTKAAAPVCDVVGDSDTTPTSDLDVTLAEWSIEHEGDSASAGIVNLVVHNEGNVEHEIAIENGAGKLIGEIEPFASGSTCEGAFELAAGSYTLLCEIVDEDGMSHAEHGMKAQLTVK
ncbi:MAG: hypothetical protein QOD30_313 [Actinomycetota bacterium]|nr:hypothetical protein [Actinomycetota bacterium]